MAAAKKSSKKSTGPKLKFGSPEWQKRYGVGAAKKKSSKKK